MPGSTRTLRILDEAMADAEAAVAWYRAEAGDEVAARLAQEIDIALDQISNWPFSGRAHDESTRGLLLRTFPHVVFYRVSSETIDVLAIGHQRRDPGFWKER